MANVDSPFGLKPVRHRNGAPWNGMTVPCYIEAGYNSGGMFIGDPVIKVAGGSNTAAVTAPGAGKFNIGTLPSIELAAAGDANRVSGVIVGFAADPTNLGRQYNPTSTARVAFVCMDPDVVFEIQADGAIPAASIGLNAVFIKTHSGSTSTGLSGVELDTTSDVPAADASNQMLILRAVNREDNDTTLTHAKVEVLLINHTEAHGNTANGDGILGI
jgi:hypothetical protein